MLVLFAAPPGARAGHPLEHTVRHHPHLDASRTLVELLPLLPGLEGAERAVAGFLSATALAEIGLGDEAAQELRRLLDDRAFEGAASVALSRVWAAPGDDPRLLALAARAPWPALSPSERGELGWRAARAAYRQGRFSEAERWIDEIPAGSEFAPFGLYLRAQTAVALGRPLEAIEPATTILSLRSGPATLPVLQDRTAILLGDVYTEIGRYDDAVRSLGRPAEEGPFAARAARDRLVARGLAGLAAGEFAGTAPVIGELHAYLAKLAEEVEAAVADPAGLDERVRELEGSWPPRFSVYARREWAAAHARRALAGAGEGSRGGLLGALRHRPDLAGRPSGHRDRDPWLPRRASAARFFYPPPAEVDRLVRALALLEEPVGVHGEACAVRAAVGMRRRVASWLLGEAAAPGLVELHAVASRCDAAPPPPELVVATRERLRQALRDEAARVREGFRRDRLEIEMAIGEAWRRHVERLEAVREGVEPDDEARTVRDSSGMIARR